MSIFVKMGMDQAPGTLKDDLEAIGHATAPQLIKLDIPGPYFYTSTHHNTDSKPTWPHITGLIVPVPLPDQQLTQGPIHLICVVDMNVIVLGPI